jgi:AMP nucleosidase
MPLIADFIAPTRHTDPAEALAQVQRIYQQQIGHLRQPCSALWPGTPPSAMCAPATPLCACNHTVARADTKLAYGFVEGPALRNHADPARPVCHYYLEQFRLLRKPRRGAGSGHQHQPIPCTSRLPSTTISKASSAPERRMLMRDVFDLPDLAAMDDGIANGTWRRPGEAQPLSLFTAPRVDYSLHRLRHYTGTAPEWFQNFVLFTNYQFYIDEFMRLGHAEMAKPDSEYIAFIEPGNVVTRRVGLPAEAGDELGAAAAPAADAGLPPGARRPQRHHHGQHRRGPGQRQDHHRPHRRAAPARLDDAGPLRRPAQQPAAGRLRAGPRLCARRPCAGRRAAAVGAHSRAGRDPAGAAAGRGRRHADGRADLKRIMRTGTVASTDNRNWELLPDNLPQRRFSQSRAVALDMESATIAANGFRFRVPYGTLLCVSDKPLHGEIKLPGMANHFYRERVDQHLRIGMRAIDILRGRRQRLHSRKLRSFAEVAFQ